MKNVYCRIEKLIYLFVFEDILEKKNLRHDKVISWEIIAQTEREQEIMSPKVQKVGARSGITISTKASKLPKVH